MSMGHAIQGHGAWPHQQSHDGSCGHSPTVCPNTLTFLSCVTRRDCLSNLTTLVWSHLLALTTAMATVHDHVAVVQQSAEFSLTIASEKDTEEEVTHTVCTRAHKELLHGIVENNVIEGS